MSDFGIKAKNAQRVLGILRGFKEGDILEKGRRVPIGTISNGYKKVAEGKWRKVGKGGPNIGRTKDGNEYDEEGKPVSGKKRPIAEQSNTSQDTGDKKIENLSDQELDKKLKELDSTKSDPSNNFAKLKEYRAFIKEAPLTGGEKSALKKIKEIDLGRRKQILPSELPPTSSLSDLSLEKLVAQDYLDKKYLQGRGYVYTKTQKFNEFFKKESDDSIKKACEILGIEDKEDVLIKGRVGQEGEIREWGGKKYQKTGGKWKEVTDPKDAKKSDDPSKSGKAQQSESAPGGGAGEPPIIDKHQVAQMTHMKSLVDQDPKKAYEIYQSLTPEAQHAVPQEVVNKLVEASYESEKADENGGVDYDKLGKKTEKKKDTTDKPGPFTPEKRVMSLVHVYAGKYDKKLTLPQRKELTKVIIDEYKDSGSDLSKVTHNDVVEIAQASGIVGNYDDED